MNYKDYITEVPDFPEDGISYKDISPLLKHGNMYRLALMKMLQGHNNELWAGVESRGFLIASGLSQLNGGGVLMIRKPGKLPPPVVHKRYFLEYGQDALEVQPNTEEHKKSVVLVDDVLATGGTLKASYELLTNNINKNSLNVNNLQCGKITNFIKENSHLSYQQISTRIRKIYSC